MTPQEKRDLANANAVKLADMDDKAAGMVKSLLLNLGANDTFITLRSPQSHRVDYELKEGTLEMVQGCAEDLGLTATATTIVVPQ